VAEHRGEQTLGIGTRQRELVGVTQKTLSNYVNHIAETPLDDAFNAQKWAPPGASSR
jgi:hypothetical protein